MYKSQDYRCLKPYSNKNSEKWKFYSMPEYQKASTDEEWKKIKSFKYDNDFNNWIDPSVFKKFTSSIESARKSWKDSYGFPIVNLLPWTGIPGDSRAFNYTTCIKSCAKEVSS